MPTNDSLRNVLVIGLSLGLLIVLPPAFRRVGSRMRRLLALVPRGQRTAALTALLLVAAPLLFGAYWCVDVGRACVRFETLDLLVPRVLALSVAREIGSPFAGASVMTAALVGLDGRARAATTAPASSFRRQVVLAAAVTPLAYVASSVLLLVGALATWRLYFGEGSASLLHGLHATLCATDVLFGLGRSAVYGLIVAGLLVGGRRVWLSPKAPLSVKLVLGGAAFVIVYLVEPGIWRTALEASSDSSMRVPHGQ